MTEGQVMNEATIGVNEVTHCTECGNPLNGNRYNRHPKTQGRCKNKAWCRDCYERLSRKCQQDKAALRRGLDFGEYDAD